MLHRYSTAIFFAACVLIMPLRAADCHLTATPSPMLAGGLAEPLGDLLLYCTSGSPGAAVEGMLLLGVDEKLVNQIGAQAQVLGLTVSVVNGAVDTPISSAAATTRDGLSFTITGVKASFDSYGQMGLRVSGLRAPTGAKVQAGLGFAGTIPLKIYPQAVTVGDAVSSFLDTTPDALLQPNSEGLANVDLTSVIAKMNPNMTVRVTESDPAAFHPKLGIDNSGTRFSVRFPNLPDGSRVFAPDAIAGSDAELLTTSGLLAGAPWAGRYMLSDPPVSSLLLVRVKGVAADGSGGTLAWQPVPGLNSLAELPISEADYLSNGAPSFVYEVVDANPMIQESFQIPLYAFAGPTPQNGLIAVRAALQLAPVPASNTAPASLPTPRYTGVDIVGPDCTVLRDCTATWFPELRVEANSASTRFLPLNSGSVQGFLTLMNKGDGVALWSASVDYGRGPAGWLRLGSTTGFVASQIGLTYSLSPFSLRPGTYHATVVFTLTNTPDGSRPSVSQPIELIVKPRLPVVRR